MNRAIRLNKIIPLEPNSTISRNLSKYVSSSTSIISSLQLSNVLTGHKGCVNTLCWSSDGSLLLSGHSGNIFSIKILHDDFDQKLITCGIDSSIRVFSFNKAFTAYKKLLIARKLDSENNDKSPLYIDWAECFEHDFLCHSDPVKRICTIPYTTEFLSCSEDGTVRHFDTREFHACSLSSSSSNDYTCSKNILVDYSDSGINFYSMSVNKFLSQYFAVCGNSEYIFLHDRRMIKPNYFKPPSNKFSSCVAKFTPSDLFSNKNDPFDTSYQLNFRETDSMSPRSNGSDDYVIDTNIESHLGNIFHRNISGNSTSSNYQYFSVNDIATNIQNSSDLSSSSSSSSVDVDRLSVMNLSMGSRSPNYQIRHDDIYVSCVRFSCHNSFELLGTWNSNYIYLFDIRKSLENNHQDHIFKKKNQERLLSSDFTKDKERYTFDSKPFSSKKTLSPSTNSPELKHLHQKNSPPNILKNSDHQNKTTSSTTSDPKTITTGSNAIIGFSDKYKNLNLQYFSILLEDSTNDIKNGNITSALQGISQAILQAESDLTYFEQSGSISSIHSRSEILQFLNNLKALFSLNRAACHLYNTRILFKDLFCLFFNKSSFDQNELLSFDIPNSFTFDQFDRFYQNKDCILEILDSLKAEINISSSNSENPMLLDSHDEIALENILITSILEFFVAVFEEYFKLFDLKLSQMHDNQATFLQKEAELGSADIRLFCLVLKESDRFKYISSLYEKSHTFFKENPATFVQEYKLCALEAGCLYKIYNDVFSFFENRKPSFSLPTSDTNLTLLEKCLDFYKDILSAFFDCFMRFSECKHPQYHKSPDENTNLFSINLIPGPTVSQGCLLHSLYDHCYWQSSILSYFMHKNKSKIQSILPNLVDSETSSRSDNSNSQVIEDNNLLKKTDLGKLFKYTLSSSDQSSSKSNKFLIPHLSNENDKNNDSSLSTSNNLSSMPETSIDIQSSLFFGKDTLLSTNNCVSKIFDASPIKTDLIKNCEPRAKVFSFIKKYKGHCNVETLKDVNFFGPNSEFIVSGSDDGNLFIWNKEGEFPVSVIKCDSEVVNVIESYNNLPVIAAGGISDNIHILSPGIEPFKSYYPRYKNQSSQIKNLLQIYKEKYIKAYLNSEKALNRSKEPDFSSPIHIPENANYSSYSFDMFKQHNTSSSSYEINAEVNYSKLDKHLKNKKTITTTNLKQKNPVPNQFTNFPAPEKTFSELGFPITSTNQITNIEEISASNELSRINVLRSRNILARYDIFTSL
ncbi:hypothetical protein BB560_004637 [Smittium megazygosporum]|uniref:Uncharacterized protein n=1 Tax=Smittium megazygosporum TaxID=133381 RepID=A0A2T9Z8T2_9FUNG|nr:hypothetical protein BB560_004637 [Smittium megazygosporum]